MTGRYGQWWGWVAMASKQRPASPRPWIQTSVRDPPPRVRTAMPCSIAWTGMAPGRTSEVLAQDDLLEVAGEHAAEQDRRDPGVGAEAEPQPVEDRLETGMA